MVTRFVSTALRGGRTAILSLALIGALLPTAHGGVSPALAAPAATPGAAFDDKLDPDARLQIVINSIKIIDDRDWGEGDMSFKLYFWRVNPDCADDATGKDCTTGLLTSAPMEFGANDGDVINLNRTIPEASKDAAILDPSIGVDSGIPMIAGERYGLALMGIEEDPISDDDMGTFFLSLTADNKWNVGPAVATPAMAVADPTSCFPIPFACSFTATPAGGFVADYSVNYEIRRAPLPELLPTIRAFKDSSGLIWYCGRVTNQGERPSGDFKLTARADQNVIKVAPLPGLQVGAYAESCLLRSDLPAGQHTLSFRVDEDRQIPEMDEHNNQTQAAVPAILAAQPKLTVSAVRVNDKANAGPQDCASNNNAVIVTLQNTGSAASAASSVRLVIDNEPTGSLEKPVAAIEPGASLDVRFENLRLKKGAHSLAATTNAAVRTMAASPDDDGVLTVNVSCKDNG